MITVTSFYYFIFLILGLAVYYILPKRLQWIVLLCCSIAYYFLAATGYTLLYLIFSTIVAYVSTLFIERKRPDEGNNRLLLWVSLAAIAADFTVWFVIRGGVILE